MSGEWLDVIITCDAPVRSIQVEEDENPWNPCGAGIPGQIRHRPLTDSYDIEPSTKELIIAHHLDTIDEETGFNGHRDYKVYKTDMKEPPIGYIEAHRDIVIFLREAP